MSDRYVYDSSDDGENGDVAVRKRSQNGGNGQRSPMKRESKSASPSPRKSHSRSREDSTHRRSKKSKSTRRKSRSRSRSRSQGRRERSRSDSRERRHVRRKRSRSRSNDLERESYRRRHSRSPGPKRHMGFHSADPPPPSRCLGVFGMSMYTDEKALARHFSHFGPVEDIQIIFDRKTQRSRGFGFVYFERLEDAVAAKDKALGLEIDGQRVRIDFSVTKGPHNPTPGAYMGKSSRRDEYSDRRSGSPRRSRSRRSYSRSPRR